MKIQKQRIFKIIFVNLFLFLLLFILCDYFLLAKQVYQPVVGDIGGYTDRFENNLEYDKNKKSIITIGCSFTYGTGAEEKETPAYKLQQLTKRKTYNRGIAGYGPQQVLRDIQLSDFFNKDKISEPEYVIYTFISDHIRRMYVNYFYEEGIPLIYDLYKIKNNNLILKPQKVRFENYLQMTRVAMKYNRLIFNLTSDNKKFDRLKLYLFAMKNELDKRYKDTKLVVLVYHPELDAEDTHNIPPFRTERWNELEENGIVVLRFDSPEYDFLNDYDYKSAKDKVHPNGKAWDTIVPVIIEKLNL